MISLKRHLQEWDSLEGRIRLLGEGYLHLLKALETAAGEMSREVGEAFKDDMQAILSYLDAPPDKDKLEKSRIQAGEALRSLTEAVNRREAEYRDIIRILARAGATIAQAGSVHSEALRNHAARLEAIANADPTVETRRQLHALVHELRALAIQAQQEGEAQARQLHEELHHAREKLERASALAATDVLTGLGNRRLAESAVAQALAEAAPVSVLMIDLNAFKAVNDSFGHAQGDSLLRLVAAHIRRLVRDGDLVCRWGGDEFVVVMRHADLSVAQAIAARVHSEGFGEFLLSRDHEEVRTTIGASIGAAASCPSDSAATLLDRADHEMYAQKRRLQSASALAT
ncbi:MAG: diguanylate cyclase domain-containing protein [Terriglobales bacterium]